MHELNIVSYTAKQIEQVAKDNSLTEVSKVTLQFGEVSGVVAEYIEDCWKWYIKKIPVLQNSQLVCETIPAVTWCDGCKTTYPTVKYGKTCPHCGSGETWLLQGNELNIKEIEAC